MKFLYESVFTFSYWRYALFSRDALAKLLAVIGALYLFISILDWFKIYQRQNYNSYELVVMLAFAVCYVLITRRPVKRVKYKVPKKDLSIEVVIDDLFKLPGAIIISSNATFDTDLASGLIHAESLQGQFANRIFNGNTGEIDKKIEESLKNEKYILKQEQPGKKKMYPIGTVAKVNFGNRNYYLLAMSHIGPDRNASSTPRILDEALEGLWKNMPKKGEREDVVVPLMGTGRGRLSTPRKKIIEKIAQSFADASQDVIFANKLTIVCSPKDAKEFSINLFQVRDYLMQSLHI